MGWEERNGKLYYYRKKRIGNTVVSEYIGSGPLVDLLAQEDLLEREMAKQKQKEEKKIIEIDQEIVQQLIRIEELTRTLTHSTLLDLGFHTHKGQWRMKRYG
jgi:hypothetical protein